MLVIIVVRCMCFVVSREVWQSHKWTIVHKAEKHKAVSFFFFSTGCEE